MMTHERVIIERTIDNLETERDFWKHAAQRALEIMTVRENVQEELRLRAIDLCRLCKLWAMDQSTNAWQVADKLEKELQLENGPLECTCEV